MRGFLDRYLQFADNAIGLIEGLGWRVPVSTDLPTCGEAREGEERRVAGSAGVASRKVRCEKNAADAWAWAEVGAAALGTTYVNVAGDTMTGDLIVPDEAYGAGWNASLEVPTKNAVYDKVESLAFGDIGGILTGSTTWNPASINDDQVATVSVTVTGVVAGDPCFAGFSQFGAQNVLLEAHVSSADTVQVLLYNASGVAQNPDSGTVNVICFDVS
jgi:hypothetical protein